MTSWERPGPEAAAEAGAAPAGLEPGGVPCTQPGCPAPAGVLGADRGRARERAWKLVERTGRSLRVALRVEERADAEVVVRVSSEVVDRAAPPWITERLQSVEVLPEADSQRRKDFNRRLVETIRTSIRREWTDLPPS